MIDISTKVLDAIRPPVKEDICRWVERTVDLSFDLTSSAAGLVNLYPYQREPLAATESAETEQVTLCWSPRLGKSSIWKYALLKRIHDGGCSGLIVYPSLALAERTNRDTVVPLLSSLREVKSDLARRGNLKKDSYHIPSLRSVVSYQGGGAQIVSLTCNFCVADEADQIAVANLSAGEAEEGKNIDQMKAIRIRMQTFSPRDRMLVACSSPTNPSGSIWKEWKAGSRGEWHFRCLRCGCYFPSSRLAWKLQDGRWAGLQWEKSESGEILPDSLRWVCPACGAEHREEDAKEMNLHGKYIHQREIKINRSFQVGALGNPWLWTWLEIASAQEDAESPDGRKHLRNNILGLPTLPRDRASSSAIQQTLQGKMADIPAGWSPSLITAGVDQQKSELAGEKYWVVAVRGWDEECNSHLLLAQTVNSLPELAEILRGRYAGMQIQFALIDHGGFSNDDTDRLIGAIPQLFYYKGQNLVATKGKDFIQSETQKRIFLCNALRFKVKLLQFLYDPPRPAGYRWSIPADIQPAYLAQVAAVRPNSRMTKDQRGDLYENWVAASRKDYFDAEKMALAAMEIACRHLPPEAFQKRNKPLFWRKERLAEVMRQKR